MDNFIGEDLQEELLQFARDATFVETCSQLELWIRNHVHHDHKVARLSGLLFVMLLDCSTQIRQPVE